jgi:hypothetical protein
MLPHTRTALYRLYDRADRLIYVGISDQLGERWERHLRKMPWWPEVQRMTSEWYPDRAAAAVAETDAIQHEQPIQNVKDAGPIATLTPQEVARIGQSIAEMKRALIRFEVSLGLRPHRAERPERPRRRPSLLEDKLLRDLDEVLGTERVRLSHIPQMLRMHDPEYVPYRSLTGRDIGTVLRAYGVRVVNTKNLPQFDPGDLPSRRRHAS